MIIYSAIIWKVSEILETCDIFRRLQLVATELLFKYNTHLID